MNRSNDIAREVILRARITGERIIAIAKLVLLIPLTVIMVFVFVRGAIEDNLMTAFAERALFVESFCIAITVAYTFWVLRRLKQNKYHNSIKYVSPFIDITLLNVIIFTNALAPREALIITGSPTFIYFIFIALAILRNSPSSVIFSGIYIAISYALFSINTLTVLKILEKDGFLFWNDYKTLVRIDWDDELIKPIVMLLATILFAYIAKRSNLFIEEQTRLSVERENLKEVVIDNTKQVSGKLLTSGKTLGDAYIEFSGRIDEMVGSSSKIEEETSEEFKIVETTSRTVSDIIGLIDNVNRNIGEQSHLINETVTAIEEMGGTIRSITGTSQRASELARNLLNAAQDGSEAVSDVNSAIIETEEESKKIEEIVNIISGIANTTNLLSMNAAIEAAHAGDAGRGFAVIAEEIGKLASTSGENANQITTILKEILGRIENIGLLAHTANEKLGSIVRDANETTNVNSMIQRAMEEELTAINEVNKSLENLKAITTDVKESATSQSRGSELLLDAVVKLKNQAANVSVLIKTQIKECSLIGNLSKSFDEVVAGNKRIIEQLGDVLNNI